MRKPIAIFILLAVLLAVAASTGMAQGCAMCKVALENSAEGKELSKSFNSGILFLMGVPYAMFGVAGVFVFRAYRRRAREAEESREE